MNPEELATTEGPETQEGESASEEQSSSSEETSETKPNEEEQQQIESQGARFEDGYVIDEDGERIPLKRFREVYHEAKEGERKLDLLKRLGPEGYYKVYPDEKPQEQTQQPLQEQQNVDVGSLVYRSPDPNDPYQGMTLNEIYAENPALAHQLHMDYREKQNQATAAAQAAQQAERQDIEGLGNQIAKEIYGKESAALTETEFKAVLSKVQAAYDFRAKTGRTKTVSDAYRLMTLEEKLSEAKTKTAQSVVESLRKQPVGHIGGGPGTETGTNYEAMTEGQLSEVILNMSDSEKEKFYREATPALKRKYPSWPWD